MSHIYSDSKIRHFSSLFSFTVLIMSIVCFNGKKVYIQPTQSMYVCMYARMYVCIPYYEQLLIPFRASAGWAL
jgi:hypothetical protein